MKKIIAVITGLIAMCSVASAQLEDAKDELHKINSVFDSSIYVGFDVTINYQSDTVYGKFSFEQVTGRYILNNKNVYYKMGYSEYIQNDSFVYDIDHEQKMMMMTRQVMPVKSDLFPMKQFVDSILTWYDTLYQITMVDSADIRGIVFRAESDSLVYQRFAIYYDSASYFPTRYEVEFSSGIGETDSVFLSRDGSVKTEYVNKQLKRRIVVYFNDYFYSPSLDIFLNEQYVYFNRQSRRYSPSEKFSGYRLYTDGVDPDEPDTTMEVYPPPAEEDPL